MPEPIKGLAFLCNYLSALAVPIAIGMHAVIPINAKEFVWKIFFKNSSCPMTFSRLSCFLFLTVLSGCNPSLKNEAPFGKSKAMGINKNKKLEEASGLAGSARNPGYLWTHNDSGNPAELFLLDSTAATRKVFTLAEIKNRDWEDIALGPGPEENVNYLYIGDIGDNLSHYPLKYIYRTKEPSIDQTEVIRDFDKLIVKLSDDVRDSEALLSDPVSKNLYLISKRAKSAGVYEILYPFSSDTLIAEKVCELPLKSVNGGAISVDGKEVLLKNYEYIYYWKKAGDESFIDLLKKPAIELPYDPEPQGEAIAWARDGSGFYTLGENAKGERSKLFFYKRKQ